MWKFKFFPVIGNFETFSAFQMSILHFFLVKICQHRKKVSKLTNVLRVFQLFVVTCYEPNEDENLIKSKIYSESSLLMGLESRNVITKSYNKREKSSNPVSSYTLRLLILSTYRSSSEWQRHSRRRLNNPILRNKWRGKPERRWIQSSLEWDTDWSVRWD